MNEEDKSSSKTIGQRLRAARLLLGLSQAHVAEKAGLSQVSIQHLESGRNENSKHLVSLAKAVGVRPEWLLTGDHPMVSGPISISRPPTDLYVVVDPLTSKFSDGNGQDDTSEVSRGLAFKRTWLDREGLKTENLRIIYAPDRSNEPAVSENDALLVDRSQIEPRNGKMYGIITPEGDVIIKRLISDLAGGWVAASDHPDKSRYPDMKLSKESLEALNIVGLVVWRGGKM